jgi:NADPH-dependent 2,4-dienoyl-CoA reductase/sulfur reductase-like enzyme/nitrite reductase/ring-hydroxylating ferredoxin subunit
MAGVDKQSNNSDFSLGVDPQQIEDGGFLAGNVRGDPALLVRRGGEFFAIGSSCTHYHGPLAEGLLVGEMIRCPWHHACFDIRTGKALRAPALDPVPAWRIEQSQGKLYAREKLLSPPRPKVRAGGPKTIVIVGSGAAGLVAAVTLRQDGYDGALVMVGADSSAPYDRPNLSKDYLAGTAPEEWLPLRDESFYERQRIDLRLGSPVKSVLARERSIELESGERLHCDALLLATGADPIRLSIPGADLPHVHYLRTLADSRAIIAAIEPAKKVVVVGASFIGLEVTASLRARNVETHVVAPEMIPMARILGPELGAYVYSLHVDHGVKFHLGQTVASIFQDSVTLSSGARIPADLIIVGVGVRPSVSLAEGAGLAVDRGVLVDEFLETSAPGIFAAGDIARWPDRLTGERIRVEHWVVAERQGQTAARNMLGRKEPFQAAPFFWSQHYDQTISYVGHAPSWDRIEMSGSITDGDCAVAYFRNGRKISVASISRDLDSLRAEVELENSIGASPRQP